LITSRLLSILSIYPVDQSCYSFSHHPSQHIRGYGLRIHMSRPQSVLSTALLVLALFAAYLTTGSLVSDRLSPSIFFTLSIGLAAATYQPTLWVAAASIAASITAQCFQSIDHIVSPRRRSGWKLTLISMGNVDTQCCWDKSHGIKLDWGIWHSIDSVLSQRWPSGSCYS